MSTSVGLTKLGVPGLQTVVSAVLAGKAHDSGFAAHIAVVAVDCGGLVVPAA